MSGWNYKQMNKNKLAYNIVEKNINNIIILFQSNGYHFTSK